MRILIIGASGEIGSSVAKQLKLDGHEVILHGNSNKKILKRIADDIGARNIYLCDIRNEDKIKEMISKITSEGNLDGLVFCAGVNPVAKSIEQTSYDTWSDTVAINLTGAFLCVKYALSHLRKSESGTIILVSSIFGINSPANRGAYSVSKHGLTGLVQTLAREEGEKVKVNGICPGPIWSENVRNIFSKHAKTVGISVEEYIKDRQAQIPYGRFLQLDECASIVSFLISNKSNFLTGEMIKITGGE